LTVLARHLSFAATAAIAAFTGAASSAAQLPAQRERVVLVTPGAALEGAARTALEPWGVEILVIDAPSPGAAAPRVHEAARALALAHGVGAVVWVSEHERGHAVWVYDLEKHHVVARPLAAPPPFDEPAAAAAALSVKTLLRHSATAPPAERYGTTRAAESDPGLLPVPVPVPEPVPDPAPARVQTPPAAATLADREPPESPEQPLDPAHFEIEAAGGARFGFTRDGASEPRFGAGFAWWPDAGPLAIAVRAASGPSVAIAERTLRGDLIDATAVVGGRLRTALARSLLLSAELGAGAHLTALDGTLAPDMQPASALRVVPALELSIGSHFRPSSSFRLGLYGGLSWLLRPQRYLVRGEPVLELSRTAFEAGLVAALIIPK
jgi:hypothetical protein